MTKLIYVRGDGDYSALDFSREGISDEEAYRLAVENGGTYGHEMEDVGDSERGANGFGSSGV